MKLSCDSQELRNFELKRSRITCCPTGVIDLSALRVTVSRAVSQILNLPAGTLHAHLFGVTFQCRPEQSLASTSPNYRTLSGEVKLLVEPI